MILLDEAYTVSCASPDGLRSGVFYQVVVDGEFWAMLAVVGVTWIGRVAWRVETAYPLSPSSNPKSPFSVNQHGVGGYVSPFGQSQLVQGAPLSADTVYAMLPRAEINGALPVFGKALNIGKIEAVLFAVGIYHLGVALMVEFEFLVFSGVSHQEVVVSHPHVAIAGGEKRKHALACCLDGQLVDSKALCGFVHSRQSSFCSYPNAIVVIFRHAAYAVAWEHSWRLGVIAIGLEEIAVVGLDAIV